MFYFSYVSIIEHKKGKIEYSFSYKLCTFAIKNRT